MKKLFKKIGIIGLIVGVLSPFITLPKVNAANDGCAHYLNHYLFLDEVNIAELLSDNDRYVTDYGHRNYSRYLYNIPDIQDNQSIEVTSVSEVALETPTALENFYLEFVKLVDSNNRINVNEIGNYRDIVSTEPSNDYESSLLHGYWGDDLTNTINKSPYWEQVLNQIGKDASEFPDKTIQNYIRAVSNNIVLSSVLDSSIGGASETNNGTIGSASGYHDNFLSFLQQIIQDVESNNFVNSKSNSEKYIISGTNGKYINTNITRYFKSTSLANYSFGLTNEDGTYKFSSLDKAKEFATDYRNNSENTNVTEYATLLTNNQNVDFDLDLSNTYYWPVMYDVEYKVCNTSTSNTWTLTYDDNVDDNSVKNMPNPLKVEASVGTSINVSSTKPERTDYVFKKWCTEHNGSGDCYEAGQEVKNTSTTSLTLFAQWQKSGTVDNEKQGVISYVIGFAAVGLIASGLYYVINKKNLFKQI